MVNVDGGREIPNSNIFATTTGQHFKVANSESVNVSVSQYLNEFKARHQLSVLLD